MKKTQGIMFKKSRRSNKLIEKKSNLPPVEFLHTVMAGLLSPSLDLSFWYPNTSPLPRHILMEIGKEKFEKEFGEEQGPEIIKKRNR